MATNRLGVNAKLYYMSAGTWDSETWTEFSEVDDLNETPGWQTATGGSRASGIEQKAKTIPTLTVDGTIQVNEANASYLAMRAAYKSRDPINVLQLSGPKDSNGAEGFKGYMHVTTWGAAMGRGAVMYRKFTLEPAIVDTAATPFKSVVVAAGAPVYTNFLPPS